MASRLFHTVVAVGIALAGAACAEPTEGTTKDESALTAETAKPAAETPAATPPAQEPGPNWDAFCDATWPTTKGGAWSVPACVDPYSECQRGTAHQCFKPIGTEGACVHGSFGADRAQSSVCVDKGEWQCKPGRVAASDCKCFVLEGETTCPPEKTEPKPAAAAAE